MFSSKSFIVSILTFRSLIHFEFIFVYGVRKCSNFILLHVAIQFSQHHLLKRLDVLHCIFLPPLLKIRWSYVRGFISGLSILFHWSKLLWGITSHQAEWPSSKNLQTINAGEGVEKREPFYTVGGNVNWYSHYGEQYGSSSKTKNRTTILPSNPTPGHIPRENHNSKRYRRCGTYIQWNITQP